MNLKGLVKPELKERFLNLLQTPHTNWYTGGTYYTNPNLVWKLKRVRVIGNSRYKTLRNFPNTETCNEVDVYTYEDWIVFVSEDNRRDHSYI